MILEELLNLVSAELGTVVNVEGTDPLFYELPTLKTGPRHYYHHGSYCHFAKLHGSQDACHRHKRSTVVLGAHGRSFYGCCPNGVWEHVEPVVENNHRLAMIYVGHYQAHRPLLTIQGHTYDGPELPRITPEIHERIREKAAFIRQFILYAYASARANGYERRKHNSVPHYQRICEQFIQNHYHQPIRLMDLAKLLNVNTNYLGKIIRDYSGKTFRQILCEHRIAQAKVHLSSESLPVTKVAYSCGFQDSNYFSTVFYEHTGMTPSQWRQVHMTPEVRALVNN
jgi:AraC-like DNA-binding protein